jgi:hypothetical protein
MYDGSRDMAIDQKEIQSFYARKPPTPPIMEEEYATMDAKDLNPKEMYIRSVADDKIVAASNKKVRIEREIGNALQQHLSLEHMFLADAAKHWEGNTDYLQQMQQESLSQQIQITRSRLGEVGEGHYQIIAQGGDLDMRYGSNSPK